MARTIAELPAGTRLTDQISLGVIAKTFPMARVKEVLRKHGRAGRRQRDLPAHVMVYYVIALALYMQASCREVLRCLLEGLKWLHGPAAVVRVTGKSGISQARVRLGVEPVRELHDELVKPIAGKTTKDGSYLNRIYPSLRDRRHDLNAVIRRKLPQFVALPPSGPRRVPPGRPRRNPG